uniref:Uncharacterized protein n=1 Tax=Anguilla anguilla TaxID=7936 RepID=A0A0E9WM71_ANGAN
MKKENLQGSLVTHDAFLKNLLNFPPLRDVQPTPQQPQGLTCLVGQSMSWLLVTCVHVHSKIKDPLFLQISQFPFFLF